MKDLYLSVNAQPIAWVTAFIYLFIFLSSSEQYIMQMYFKHMEFILNRLH